MSCSASSPEAKIDLDVRTLLWHGSLCAKRLNSDPSCNGPLEFEPRKKKPTGCYTERCVNELDHGVGISCGVGPFLFPPSAPAWLAACSGYATGRYLRNRENYDQNRQVGAAFRIAA